MRLRRLLVPGRFQDVYLYRSWLIGLTNYRSLKFVYLPTASDAMLQFFQASALGAKGAEQDDIGELTPEDSGLQLVHGDVEMTPAFNRETDIAVSANVVLDLAVYRNHLYLGTDKGLYSAPLELSQFGRLLDTSLDRQHDARALKVTARFDTVAVSCGDNGLFGAIRASEAPHDRLALRKLEKQSLKTSWLHTALVNYPSHREWEVLPATEEGWAG